MGLGDGESKGRNRSTLDFGGGDRRNVIQISAFRRPVVQPSAPSPVDSQKLSPSPARKTLVFYINESGRWLEMLHELETWKWKISVPPKIYAVS